MAEPINIQSALENIGEAVMVSLSYKPYPLDKLDKIINLVEDIRNHPQYLRECEEHLKSSGSNYVLFFLSNIIYNLKRQGELRLTPEVLKWLGSVWINFLRRNRSYQDMFTLFDDYRIKFRKYYPGEGSFVNQINNVNLVKEDFILESEIEGEQTPLKNLEKFYQVGSEIIAAMKPTYFFLMDYYYERKMNTGVDYNEAVQLEMGGLSRFGFRHYTYFDIAVLLCQALGILEAVYLLLKKKKSSRRLIMIDGKQKFLTVLEIYAMYLERFSAMKKELTNLNK